MQLLAAIKTQISPVVHSYIHGEPKRLALATLYILVREELTKDEIATFVKEVTSPLPFKAWHEMYMSTQGLTKLHNTRSYLLPLYVLSEKSSNQNIVTLRAMLSEKVIELL